MPKKTHNLWWFHWWQFANSSQFLLTVGKDMHRLFYSNLNDLKIVLLFVNMSGGMCECVGGMVCVLGDSVIPPGKDKTITTFFQPDLKQAL